MEVIAADPTALLGAIFKQESERVFGFLLHRCGSRAVAEDLLTETFLAAGKFCAEGRGEEVTRGWLLTVARRRLVDHWRTSSRQQRRFDRLRREFSSEPAAPETDPDGAVEEALASLSDRQRAALVLRYVDGFSTSEVAEALGSSYKATESLLGRAKQAFRTAYDSNRNDAGEHDG